ncbi:cell division protein FtsL [Simplicispira hankyongi]|uniref:Cell division protein FtsL n=1 Tax=Simplicispira hankyongi TaxID=2315688 RepID=A0A398CA70_9BURK|nr:cell division protein FtsL [Simplicispira hankyongi]RID98531.1 cell division protein FtsL [Simplicispira hankyongi]
MARINLFLIVVVLGSALYLVHTQYESRQLYTALDRARSEARRLDTEHDRLQVEKRAQATPLRVESLARSQLAMRPATPAITRYITQAEGAAAGLAAVSSAAPAQSAASAAGAHP